MTRSFLIAMLGLAAAAISTPSTARPKCELWSVKSGWQVILNGGIPHPNVNRPDWGGKPLIQIQQNGNQFSGVAQWEWMQTNPDGVEERAGEDGQVVGHIDPTTRQIEFTASFPTKGVIEYRGWIVEDGRVEGIQRTAEQSAADPKVWPGGMWHFQEPLACAPAQPPAAPELTTPLGWFSRADIAQTPWTLDDLNTVAWAQAARAAVALCASKGAGAGHFSGHQDPTKGVYAGQCAKDDAVVRDASAQEIAATEWGFTDVNQVSWAQANRAAERLCAGANQGFAGGHFNGHQVNGNYGLVCYRGASQWFDATGGEIAATGWGFATPKLDDVQWSQAMRAATGFCQAKGFHGGFMNGHQAPDKYGVVCQKGLGY